MSKANRRSSNKYWHKIHDDFFKKIYSNPEYAKDLVILALSAEELALFDPNGLVLCKDSTKNAKTGKEGLGDLHFLIPLKDCPHLQVHFGVFCEHKIKGANRAIEQLRSYCLREMDATGGLVFGILINQGKYKVINPNNYLEYLLGKDLPAEVITQLSSIFSNFFIRSVDLPSMTVDQICLDNIKTAPALLAMKYIRNLRREIMSMIIGKRHFLRLKNKDNFFVGTNVLYLQSR